MSQQREPGTGPGTRAQPGVARAWPGATVVDRPDGVRVVDATAEASPASMAAALRALAVAGRGEGGEPRRTWAVLGEMTGLGADRVAEHDRLGRLAVRLDIARLVAVGPGAVAVHAAARHEGSWGDESVHVPDAGAAESLLRAELRPGDVVLVKGTGSARAELERLAARLAGADGRDPGGQEEPAGPGEPGKEPAP